LQLLQWIGRSIGLMKSCAERYGDLFTIQLSSLGPLIFCNHPQMIQENFTMDSNPDVFDPNRFLTRTYSAYEFIGFGGGNRRCLGMAFALFEMKRVLATLLTQFRFELYSSQPIHPIRRGVTLAPPSQFALCLVSQSLV
jgi:Cytochrome P450